jgi:hypothetical protein
LILLTRSEQQLSQAAMTKGVSLDEEQLNTLLQISHKEATQEDIDKILEFAKTVKLSLYNVMNVPIVQVVIFTFVSSGIVLFVLIQYNEVKKNYQNFTI